MNGALLGRLTTLAVTVLLLGAVGLVGLLVVVPVATNGAALTVLTGSMEPSIPRGSTVLVRPVEPAELRAGDVITFRLREGDDVEVTHRIVAVDDTTVPRSFITQGDANPRPDPQPVAAGMVRGEVWASIPWVGHLGSLVQSRTGVTTVLVALGVMLLVPLLRSLGTEEAGSAVERQAGEP